MKQVQAKKIGRPKGLLWNTMYLYFIVVRTECNFHICIERFRREIDKKNVDIWDYFISFMIIKSYLISKSLLLLSFFSFFHIICQEKINTAVKKISQGVTFHTEIQWCVGHSLLYLQLILVQNYFLYFLFKEISKKLWNQGQHICITNKANPFSPLRFFQKHSQCYKT